MIRDAVREDLDQILELYLDLHEESIPDKDDDLMKTWDKIISDPDHHLIVYELDGKIVSSCVEVIIPNLTRYARPYAFIENVVTAKEHRGKGYASQCLAYARELAIRSNCYKIMLLTGSKDPATHRFYQYAGFNANDKTAYVMWL
ncbi:MAG: GNAT family N-acetyltransferase [Saccharofermentans sp.]|nr:GNAT family N-acetyltransferase [Saccharofermentans sp.]